MATILIFEDNMTLALQWRQLLETHNHYVCCCTTIRNALAIATAIQPDIVIMDMMIKQNDRFVPEGGLTLLARLKMEYDGSPYIIGVSGYKPGVYSKSTPLELAKRTGVNITLYKPIAPDHLVEIINQCLVNQQPSLKSR